MLLWCTVPLHLINSSATSPSRPNRTPEAGAGEPLPQLQSAPGRYLHARFSHSKEVPTGATAMSHFRASPYRDLGSAIRELEWGSGAEPSGAAILDKAG